MDSIYYCRKMFEKDGQEESKDQDEANKQLELKEEDLTYFIIICVKI